MKRLIGAAMALNALVFASTLHGGEIMEDSAGIKALSDSICEKARSDEERVISVIHAVHNKIKPDASKGIPAGAVMSVMDRWNAGVGWCNHQVKIAMYLLKSQGISSRMLYLVDKSGTTSPHTIGEALVKDRFVIIDPLFDMVARNSRGELISRYDVMEDSSVISSYPTQQERLKDVNVYNNDGKLFKEWIELYTNPAILAMEL